MATALKDQGNVAFKSGDFKQAELLYTRAIQKDPKNDKLFTNRAMARIKLQSWDACIDDCLNAIALCGTSVKGFYCLAQAQLALKHPNEALTSALTAYELSLEANDANLASICSLVLEAKKHKWEMRERERIRQRSELLAQLEDFLEQDTKSQLSELQDHMDERGAVEPPLLTEERKEIEEAGAKKLDELRRAFALSNPETLQRRRVPEYMIDDISFAVMFDPVITITGHTYERATIQKHLEKSETDPMTRSRLTKSDLRPNLALKQACAEFLEENGWAVDY